MSVDLPHPVSPSSNTVLSKGENCRTEGMPDERATRIPKAWQRMVDITQEFNALIGSLNQLEAVSDNDLYQDCNFIDDVSSRP